MKVRHMDTPQKILFFGQFFPVIILLVMFASCGIGDTSNLDTKEEGEVEKIKGTENLYKLSFEGHDYVVYTGVGLVHSASCRGRH